MRHGTGVTTAGKPDMEIMHILYPYNEILPKRSAHDVYIVRNCAGLAEAGADVTLAFGTSSLPDSRLLDHYHIAPRENLQWRRLPILRRNYGLPFNLGILFLWATQKLIQSSRPEWVALSVLKQGNYHLKRNVPGVKYLYEVHELGWYPGRSLDDAKTRTRVEMERGMFSRADALTVTTEALKKILTGPPYSIKTPIAVVPLAVDFLPLPPLPETEGVLQLMYIGQMYQGQGVELLLEALSRTTGVHLTLVGGRPEELSQLNALCERLGIRDKTTFAGFLPPGSLHEIAARCHAFVAPFSATGRMPYVAHTKLAEYAAWQRPVIAPDLPVTREHFTSGAGWIPFEADNAASLAAALMTLTETDALHHHTTAAGQHRTVSWSARCSSLLAFLRAIP